MFKNRLLHFIFNRYIDITFFTSANEFVVFCWAWSNFIVSQKPQMNNKLHCGWPFIKFALRVKCSEWTFECYGIWSSTLVWCICVQTFIVLIVSVCFFSSALFFPKRKQTVNSWMRARAALFLLLVMNQITLSFENTHSSQICDAMNVKQ